MKSNQILVKERYVSPCCIEEVVLESVGTVLAASGNSDLYGDSNHAGTIMEDNNDYTYDL